MLTCITSDVRRPASFTSVILLVGFVGLFLVSHTARAGQATAPSSIVGQVRDETGATLPGVTVTARSPALQVAERLTVTDDRGEYRLTPLPIGIYVVDYALTGFQPVRQADVRLTAGFVAKLDHVLKLGGVAETVVVSGASPTVDVQSTATRTEVSADAVDNLPTNRDGIKALMTMVPGILPPPEVGSSGLTGALSLSVYGQSGAPWTLLEGVLIAAPSGGSSESHIDFDSVEGVRVQTAGSNAEMPRRGVLLDAVVKSGGNQAHGSLYTNLTSGRFEGNNVDQALIAQGVKEAGKLQQQKDYSANWGGKIIRDKLWFYVGARYQGQDREAFGEIYPDGTPIAINSWMAFHVAKASYQMTPANRLIAFNSTTYDFQRRGASRFAPAESREEAFQRPSTSKVEWQWAHQNLVTSVQYGIWQWTGDYSGMSTNTQTTDLATQQITGEHFRAGQKPDVFRRHFKGIASWYRPDLFGGDHEFKAGLDQLNSGFAYRVPPGGRKSGNYQLFFNNGVPAQIGTYNYPVSPENRDMYLGVYAQDTWTIARRLTLSLGLRFDHDNAYAPPQCREAGDFAAAECFPLIQLNVWNAVAPRVHGAYDLFGNGKTVVKGGWGRFNHLRELVPDVTGANRNVATTITWLWRDLNGNRNYDRGEVNLDPNGLDFLSISGSTDARPNPDQQQPKMDEFSITLEHELMANWSFRLTGLYTRNFNSVRLAEVNRPYGVYNIPITNPDPGPDARIGTADDPGTFITYYDYPATLRGRQFAGTMLVNDPRADQTFRTIEIATSKRLAHGWQFLAAYTATKKNLPFAAGAPALNPNAEIFTADRTWDWVAKASAAYAFPYGILASANFQRRSGTPQARQVLFGGGQQIPTIVLNVEPLGSLRLPSVSLLDVRGEKRFALGAGRAVQLRVEVFNALNANTVVSRIVRSGSTFLLPTTPASGGSIGSILFPRIVQFALSYTF